MTASNGAKDANQAQREEEPVQPLYAARRESGRPVTGWELLWEWREPLDPFAGRNT